MLTKVKEEKKEQKQEKQEKEVKAAQPETQTTEPQAETPSPNPNDSAPQPQAEASQESDNPEPSQDATQKSDNPEPEQDAAQQGTEPTPQPSESPIPMTAVRDWMAQRSFSEKLTAVMLWQLARIEHVFEGTDAKIGNDIYTDFSTDILCETDVPPDSELIRGLFAAWQIMPVSEQS